jgi:hypothetical protein
MEKIALYQQYVQQVLRDYVGEPPADDPVDVEFSFDTERNHYQIINIGWIDEHRVYGSVVHLNIRNDKIYIQHDGTEIGIATELLKLGVPKSDIVLAFQSPYRRKYGEFAAE